MLSGKMEEWYMIWQVIPSKRVSSKPTSVTRALVLSLMIVWATLAGMQGLSYNLVTTHRPLSQIPLSYSIVMGIERLKLVCPANYGRIT